VRRRRSCADARICTGLYTRTHTYALCTRRARTRTHIQTCVLRTGQEDGYRSQRESTAGVLYLRADSGPCYRGRSVLSSRSGLYLSSPLPCPPSRTACRSAPSFPATSSRAGNLSIRVAPTTRWFVDPARSRDRFIKPAAAEGAPLVHRASSRELRRTSAFLWDPSQPKFGALVVKPGAAMRSPMYDDSLLIGVYLAIDEDRRQWEAQHLRLDAALASREEKGRWKSREESQRIIRAICRYYSLPTLSPPPPPPHVHPFMPFLWRPRRCRNCMRSDARGNDKDFPKI